MHFVFLIALFPITTLSGLWQVHLFIAQGSDSTLCLCRSVRVRLSSITWGQYFGQFYEVFNIFSGSSLLKMAVLRSGTNKRTFPGIKCGTLGYVKTFQTVDKWTAYTYYSYCSVYSQFKSV